MTHLGQLDVPKVPGAVNGVGAICGAHQPTRVLLHGAHAQVAEAPGLGPALFIGVARLDPGGEEEAGGSVSVPSCHAPSMRPLQHALSMRPL